MKSLSLTATNCLNQAKVQLRKTRVALFGCIAGVAVYDHDIRLGA